MPGHGQHFTQHLLLLYQVLITHFSQYQLVLQVLGVQSCRYVKLRGSCYRCYRNRCYSRSWDNWRG